MVKAIGLGIVSMVVAACLFWSETSPAKAAFYNPDLNAALRSAPQGIHLQDFFEVSQSESNRAEVIDSTNPKTLGTQVVKITDGRFQMGGIWSRDNMRFNLRHDQTISMWLYFGNQGNRQAEHNDAGDGMAFVLQNDTRGVGAAPSFGDSKQFGETLGVWGVDNRSSQSWLQPSIQQSLANSAIQNSWALEFDTFINNANDSDQAGRGNSFDLSEKPGSIQRPHIASNYPAQPDSYHVYTPDWGLGRSYAGLIHKGLIQGNDFDFLSDAHWHHLTIRYHPDSENSDLATMSYSFDDRSLARESITRDVRINRKIIDPDHNQDARWGFTGSTGRSWENNLVVFDTVPNLVDAEASAELKDSNVPGNQPVKTGDVLEHGDHVSLQYNLKYANGSTDWHNIKALLNLPGKVRFNTATLVYANGLTEELKGVDLRTSTITHRLQQDLSDDNPSAEIVLRGVVKDESGTEPEQTSVFTGTEAVAQATLPSFKVHGINNMQLTLADPKDEAVDGSKQTLIKGQLDLSHTQFTAKDIHLQSRLNGNSQPDQAVTLLDDAGHFNYRIPANQLREGNNKLAITAVDTANNQSNEVTVSSLTAHYSKDLSRGKVAFTEVSPAVDFTGRLSGTSKLIPVATKAELTITDTRPIGNKWALQATATPLTTGNDRHHLAGGVTYVTARGRTLILSDDAQIVAEHEKDSDNNELTNVADNWQGLRGLILQLNAGAQQGTYAGEITWTLDDVPET
ncbi:hypothetical protein FD13_GL000988 [Levilactobacillus senmaizukei DSM 21775 = NBRC 103853]|uniref:Extracellular protein n=1 Tax=Levilactobacillus senmaizukei DSM 21775 = NBRC 103853 TaxID=1423803 RepID=A0A0R2DIP6_9LACO|nr:hypothetical protein [Levilactobacillus senmaizukei]KRN01525.1 hypothetical protein FD13_GL000988 [Levilactobacillus senmaizukei DSM 21775 = NBRC 103853]